MELDSINFVTKTKNKIIDDSVREPGKIPIVVQSSLRITRSHLIDDSKAQSMRKSPINEEEYYYCERICSWVILQVFILK